MPLRHPFNCPLRNGIHARPASSLEEVSRGFASEVSLLNQRTGRAANGKSVLAILSADIRQGDPCVLSVSGPDEEAAFAAMTAFVERTLPHCDDALAPVPAANGQTRLPPALRNSNVTLRHGTPMAPGVALGQIVQLSALKMPAAPAQEAPAEPAAEWRKLEEALERTIADYDRQLAAAKRQMEAELLKAHRAIARDLEFRRQLQDAVAGRGRPAAGAVADAEAHFSGILAAGGSALLRERALDIQDVCFQLLRQLYGCAAAPARLELAADTIVVAEALTPGQFLGLNRNFLKGLVLAHAGETSHTVILARSFGIPTLSGVNNLVNARLDGRAAVLDGDAGLLLTDFSEPVRRYYLLEQQRLADRQRRVQKFAGRPAATKDGHRLEIAANIVSADELAAVFAAGAEGIGMFRTEMLFLDRESAPGEEEQYDTYRRVLEAAAGRPVIIRALDAGGDKPLSFLNLPEEENPYLGLRGVRLYSEVEPLFRTQVRALVRASAHGRLKLLIPMVSTVDEARWVKRIVAEEQQRCAAEQIPHDPAMAIGAMIEVPTAAFGVGLLAEELDFFSIGSNDLLQYFMAVDRANTRLAALYDPLQPAFLRLLKQIVDGVHVHRKWIGLCGEMGGQARFLPLLAGLGLDEISVAAPVIAGLKAELAAVKLSECRQLIAAASNCATADDVAALLDQFGARRGAALFGPELVMLEVEAATKEETIQQAVNRLYVLGRTEEPRSVEESVWAREAVYSTGFGYGFAIPHCKSRSVKANSLVLLKLRLPVVWNSLDGLPVQVVILIVTREAESATEHIKIFAKLARHMMDENFRAQLARETDADALHAFLCKTLQIETPA